MYMFRGFLASQPPPRPDDRRVASAGGDAAVFGEAIVIQDHYYWAIVDYQGCPWPSTMRATRADCIREMMTRYAWISDGTTWAQLRRKGWRCVKVKMVPVEDGR